ncbi:MAG: excalibur calcium-binding domain-containing protein, partial [Acidobacteria bacterium]|nr:excalibur calcium-binding domain-containing protein [Acidobacteriota bacterium]
ANGGEHPWDGHPAHQTAPFKGDLPALAGMPDGWDLVIGNPPYMNVPAGQARRFKRLGYAARPGNLYEAFLESAAERLVKRNGSLMMIVPHSIQWSGRTETLRTIIKHVFPAIRVRTYDNRPVAVFPKTSWLEDTTNAESRQRVSVVHAEGRGHRGTSRVSSTGLIRLTAETRVEVLSCLTPTGEPVRSAGGTDGAWPVAGTADFKQLFEAMTRGPATERHAQVLTRPRTACYFLTTLRTGHISNPRRVPVHPGHDGPLDAWLALYNSRLFHSLWLMTGDAFDVTDRPYRIAKAPHAWENAKLTAEAGRLGAALSSPANLKACEVVHSGRNGTHWPNFNFHSERVPESRKLIEEIDRLLLDGYGLAPEPLLKQMETIRLGSAHLIAPGDNEVGKEWPAPRTRRGSQPGTHRRPGRCWNDRPASSAAHGAQRRGPRATAHLPVQSVGSTTGFQRRARPHHPANDRPEPKTMRSKRTKFTPPAAAIAVLAVLAPAAVAPGPARAQETTWNGLVVAPEARCSPYDSDDYRYRQSIEEHIIRDLGGVYGPYTGRWFSSGRDTDIEHIVARSEAHDSGLCRADRATRTRFSEDLRNLTLASPSVNRHQKRDHDAAWWMPPMNRCWFAGRVVAVKRAYGLTIDRRERDALARTLAGCEDTEIDMTARGATAAPAAAPLRARTGGSDALALYDDNGNGRITCAEARRHGIAPVPRSHPAYQYMRDGDGDGVVCE